MVMEWRRLWTGVDQWIRNTIYTILQVGRSEASTMVRTTNTRIQPEATYTYNLILSSWNVWLMTEFRGDGPRKKKEYEGVDSTVENDVDSQLHNCRHSRILDSCLHLAIKKTRIRVRVAGIRFVYNQTLPRKSRPWKTVLFSYRTCAPGETENDWRGWLHCHIRIAWPRQLTDLLWTNVLALLKDVLPTSALSL